METKTSKGGFTTESAFVSQGLHCLSKDKLVRLCKEHLEARESLENGSYLSFFKHPETAEQCVIVSDDLCDEFVFATAAEVLNPRPAAN